MRAHLLPIRRSSLARWRFMGIALSRQRTAHTIFTLPACARHHHFRALLLTAATRAPAAARGARAAERGRLA